MTFNSNPKKKRVFALFKLDVMQKKKITDLWIIYIPRGPLRTVYEAWFFRKLLTRAKCTFAEESDVEMHSWIPDYVLTKYRDYTILRRGNNDGNGCVLGAKYAAGAQYDRRPTMLIILGTLSLRYISQRWHLVDDSMSPETRCENVALPKYLKK